MASFWDLFTKNAKTTSAVKANELKKPAVPPANPYMTLNAGADKAASMLGKPVDFSQATPDQILSPLAQQRVQKENVYLSRAPKNEQIKSLVKEGADTAYDFFKAQEELAKPVKRNVGESNTDYALRSTGTKFLPGIASQGYKAAEVTVPALRAATVTPQVVGKLSNAFLPESVSSRVTPLMQAYSVLRSPNKWAALGNIGLDYGTDFASKLFTGKTLFENIDQSQLPDWSKGLAKTGYNIVSGLGGAKLGSKVGKYVGDVGKAAKAAIPAINEGKRVYDQTGSFDAALDAITDKNLELGAGLRSRPGKGSSEVKGYSNIPKPIDISEAKPVQKTVDQKFRTDKLNLGSDEEIAKINNRVADLGLATRNVRSFDEVKQLAQELGTDTASLLKSNRSLSDADVVALRNLINQNSDFIAKNSEVTFTDKAQNKIHQQKLRAADAQINDAVSKLIGGGTEAGRTVSAFRILANKTMDPAFWYQKAQKNRGSELSPEHKAQINDLINNNDRSGLAMYVAGLRNPSGWEKLSTLWKAGLLTNIPTHVGNIAGNVGNLATKGVADLVGTGLDKGISLFTGKRTKTVSPIEAVKGLGTGIKKGYNLLKTGVDPDELLGKYDVHGEVNFGDGFLGKAANAYTRGVFRSLGAEDAVFKGFHERGALANQAKLIALNEGLKGKAYQERVQQLLANPTEEMKMQAVEDAKVATFNNDNILSKKIGGLKAGRNKDDSLASKAFATAVDVTIPFVKTPTNVVARIAEYTPLGLLKLAAGQINKNTRGQKRFVEDFSKVVTGAGLMYLGSQLAKQGDLTGSLPADQKERDQWQAEGKQANAIRIGGTWYQLNKITPIGYLLGLAADYENGNAEGKDLGTNVATTALKGAKNLTDQTFLSGLSGTLKAVNDPEQNAASYLKQTVGSVVPALFGGIARATDPNVRVTDGVLDAIKAKIPGLSQTLAPRLNIFGEEVKNQDPVTSLINPFRPQEDKSNDPLLKELRTQGINIGLPSEKMFNTSLNPDEYARYQKVQGGILKSVLSTITNSTEYKQASAAEKQAIIEKTVTSVRSKVKEKVFPRIVKQRFNLPDDIDPEVLTNLANKLYQSEKFNGLPPDQQRELILRVVQNI